MLGTVKNEIGVLFENSNYKTVKKSGIKGDKIPTHSHEDEEIIFTVIKGKILVYLNEKEEHILNSGDILNFDGKNSISADFLEDGEIVITLIRK